MPTSHTPVKLSSWTLPKNARGHPLFDNQYKRLVEVDYLTAETMPAGSQATNPIDMNGISKIVIYGQIDILDPFYIFTAGKSDGKLNLLQEVSPVEIDSEYHFYVQLENTPRYLWIGSGTDPITITLKYTQIE